MHVHICTHDLQASSVSCIGGAYVGTCMATYQQICMTSISYQNKYNVDSFTFEIRTSGTKSKGQIILMGKNS